MTCHPPPDFKKKLQATLMRLQLLKVVGKSRRECFTPEKKSISILFYLNSNSLILKTKSYLRPQTTIKKKLEKLK